MTIAQKIRTSFTARLALWVAGFVVVISTLVVGLLASFSEEVIRDEAIDMTLQVLENSALNIDNTLRKTEMTAHKEGRRLHVNRARIDLLIEESGSLAQLQRSLPNAQLFVTRRDSSQLDTYITSEESGYRQLIHNGREMYLFVQPIGERQFSLAAICPAENIYDKYASMQRILLSWSIGGVLLLLIFLYFVIARHLRPLHLLADAAQSIADGNLETPIPDAHHHHEAARLQVSLKKMQRAQRAYMTEMQQKQATLSAQNAELQAAYDEAQDYEVKKAKFLSQMTQRMAEPVDLVCRSTDIVCRDYNHLSKTQMATLQADIQQGTETVTELLDELMHETAL